MTGAKGGGLKMGLESGGERRKTVRILTQPKRRGMKPGSGGGAGSHVYINVVDKKYWDFADALGNGNDQGRGGGACLPDVFLEGRRTGQEVEAAAPRMQKARIKTF